MDHKYFEKLRTKATIIHNIPLKFTTKKILITPNKFKYFVELINKSEFWQRVYYKKCRETSTDGDGFWIEASTKEKYNLVISDECQDGPSKLKKALDEFLKFINFDLEAFYRGNDDGKLERPDTTSTEKVQVRELKLVDIKPEPKVKKKKDK